MAFNKEEKEERNFFLLYLLCEWCVVQLQSEEFNLLLSAGRPAFMGKEKREYERGNYLVPKKAHYLESGWAGKPFTNTASHFFSFCVAKVKKKLVSHSVISTSNYQSWGYLGNGWEMGNIYGSIQNVHPSGPALSGKKPWTQPSGEHMLSLQNWARGNS